MSKKALLNSADNSLNKGSKRKLKDDVGDHSSNSKPLKGKNSQKKYEKKVETKSAQQAQQFDYKRNYNSKKYMNDEERSESENFKFFKTLIAIIEKKFEIPENSRIILAVSGGVDSVVLLDAMFQLTKLYKYDLVVCHFNHKLRDISSDRDEMFVRNLAQQYGIKFYNDSANVREHAMQYSQSIELAARNLRYNFFEKLSKSIGFTYIMTAHTSDDSAETVLFNFLRGSGLQGLSGIPEYRALSGKTFLLRPFLNFRKHDLINYANRRNLKWKEDETNTLLNYTRNKIRLDLIKKLEDEYNPQIIETINRMSKILHQADIFIKDHLIPYASSFKWEKKRSILSVNIQLLNSCNPYIQGEIIKTKLRDKFNLNEINQKTLERIIELPKLEVGSVVDISKNVIAVKDRNRIVFMRQTGIFSFSDQIKKEGEYQTNNYKLILKCAKKSEVVMNDNPNIEFFDYDLLPSVIDFRTWQAGDTIVPLGMTGTMKVSDFLVNNKISVIDKSKVAVLATSKDIIWICGHRISNKFKITTSTTKYLRAEFSCIGELNEK